MPVHSSTSLDWNIDQALGWVAWRSLAPIDELAGDLFDRHLLIKREAKPLADWCDELLLCLRRGSLNATAQEVVAEGAAPSEIRPIGKKEWLSIILYGLSCAFSNAPPRKVYGLAFDGYCEGLSPTESFAKACRDHIRTTGRPIDFYPRFDNLKFCADEVRTVFPPTGESAFVDWMQFMKQQHRRFPGKNSSKRLEIPGWDEWVRDGRLTREIAEGLIKKHRLSNPRGAAPQKK